MNPHLKQVPGLDGVRGVMALWVWLTHVVTMATLPFYKTEGLGWVLANGEFAVGVFIIISGFVISATLLGSRDHSTASYLVRRAFRLFPVYLVCLAASIAVLDLSISVLREIPWSGTRTDDRLGYLMAAKENFWTHLGLHVVLLHGIVPERVLPATSFAFMGQAWSLTLEWQFYLAAPLLVWFAGKFRLNLWTVAAGGLLLSLGALRFHQPSFLPAMLYLFFIGYVSYRLHTELSAEAGGTGRAVGMLAILAGCAFIHGPIGIAVLMWMLVFFSVEGRLGRVGQRVLGALESPAIKWLGNVSYGFYCVHMVAIFLTAWLLIEALQIRDRALYASLLIGLSLPLALLGSWLLHIVVEKPGMAWGKALSARIGARRAPAVAA